MTNGGPGLLPESLEEIKGMLNHVSQKQQFIVPTVVTHKLNTLHVIIEPVICNCPHHNHELKQNM